MNGLKGLKMLDITKPMKIWYKYKGKEYTKKVITVKEKEYNLLLAWFIDENEEELNLLIHKDGTAMKYPTEPADWRIYNI
jgi:hypothetical protein